MIFTSRLFGAEDAQSCGLIAGVLEDTAAPMARAGELSAVLGSMAPLTLRATREAMRRNRVATRVDDADLITMCCMSEDFRHGMGPFSQGKSPPGWDVTAELRSAVKMDAQDQKAANAVSGPKPEASPENDLF
ncbi:MAG: hypothetical protein AAFU80_16010 [Pseudomonadota bacterium]